MTEFLADRRPIRDRNPYPAGMVARGVFLGQGHLAIEVLVVDASAAPSATLLHEAWAIRAAGRGTPVLVVALHAGRAFLSGPGEKSPLRTVGAEEAERLCRRALDAPDRNAAYHFLSNALPGIEGALSGIRNEGLLSDHVLLQARAQAGIDVEDAVRRGAAAIGTRDRDLLRALGFSVEKLDDVTDVLRAGDQKRAVAVLLREDEIPEVAYARFRDVSPVSWALDRADRENLPWVVLVKQDRVRLYPVELGIGVGRRGRTETWIELAADQMHGDQAHLLWLVASAAALRTGGTIERLLEASKRFAAGLAERLRERVYDHVVPRLATAIARARGAVAPGVEELRLTYAMALTVLFRLLFIAYAEDRDFLPFAANDLYRARSLKTRAQKLHEGERGGPGADAWMEVRGLFDAVRRGHPDWGVPAYGGGLFDNDPGVSAVGAALDGIALADADFIPVLRLLLLDLDRDLSSPSRGPVDFRSLRVREFGTIYEGLLESELAVAGQDLAVKVQGKEEVYVPASGLPVSVATGTIYLHNRSGARKSSGSYFTPGFAVDHLLGAALVPALEAHVARLAAMDDTAAAEGFFDFRVADIAMGSGHFLVAAIDTIEKRLSALLVERPLAGVKDELATLRGAARAALGKLADSVPIDDSQLLRRQIALRCIYGVDLNPLAVDLTRLSVWVHTFVAGLPLALLDDHLVHGNALVGVATVRQLEDRFAATGTALFPVDTASLLGPAEAPLRRRAMLAETTIADVARAREAVAEARVALGPTKALCDLVVGERIDPRGVKFQFETWLEERGRIQRNPALARARQALAGLDVLHFPVAFPEVFLRRRAGFDVVLGNPPWEKLRTERHEFWARFIPGLRGMKSASDREKAMTLMADERSDLVKVEAEERAVGETMRDAVRALPGMNTGHPDLFRAFTGRFAHLVVPDDGWFGVVLPGEAFKIKGNTPVREDLDRRARVVDVQMLTNRSEWIFAGVEARKLVALVVAQAGRPGGPDGCAYHLRPEFHHVEKFLHRDFSDAVVRPSKWLRTYSAGLVLPTLPTASATLSMEVLDAMMRSPRLPSHPLLRVRRVYADVETTRDSDIYGAKPGPGTWAVYGGDSFDLWTPDTGTYYALAESAGALERVQRKRVNSPSGAPYGQMPRAWRNDPMTHPCRRPRIAYRDITNRTNTRTLVAALIPANVITVQSAPWLLWSDPENPVGHEAFLLGVMSSLIADWWIRRFVETHVEESAFNGLPVPAIEPTHPLWQRAVALAGRLAAPDERFATWAASVGVVHGPLHPADKQKKIEELDAVVARLYGLTPSQLRHIFDTFHEWTRPDEITAWAARRDRTLSILDTLP